MAKKPEYNYKSLQTEYGKMPPQAVDCLLYTSDAADEL